jgi:hypothetical protein
MGMEGSDGASRAAGRAEELALLVFVTEAGIAEGGLIETKLTLKGGRVNVERN